MSPLEWMTTYNVRQYNEYCNNALNSASFYSRRIMESRSAYSTRPFFHDLPPHNINTEPHPLIAKPKSGIVPWTDEMYTHVPMRNRELTQASFDAMTYFGLNASTDGDALRILFIKSHKTASSSMSSILAGMAMARGWEVPGTSEHSLFAMKPTNPRVYSVLLHHNYNHHTSKIPRPDNSSFEFWGGYEAWMDFYVPRAWRILNVVEPRSVCQSGCSFFLNTFSSVIFHSFLFTAAYAFPC